MRHGGLPHAVATGLPERVTVETRQNGAGDVPRSEDPLRAGTAGDA